MVIEAKFENGVFKPIGEVRLEEGTTVEIHINHEKTTERSTSIRDLGFTGIVHIADLDLAAGPIDGDFGPSTHAAVVSFQASRGLVIDGEVGQKTARGLGVKLPEA